MYYLSSSNRLLTLECNNANLMDISASAIEDFNNQIQSLIVMSSNILEITSGVLNQFKSVKELVIMESNLKFLHDDSFEGLTF